VERENYQEEGGGRTAGKSQLRRKKKGLRGEKNPWESGTGTLKGKKKFKGEFSIKRG